MADQNDTRHLGTIFDGGVDPKLVSDIQSLKKNLTEIDAALTSLGKGGDVAAAGAEKVGKASGEAAKRGGEFAKALELIERKYGKGTTESRGMIKELIRLDDQYRKLSTSGKDTTQVLGRQYNAVNAAGRAIKNYAESAKTSGRANDLLVKTNRKLASGLSDTAFSATSLGKSLKTNADRSDQFHGALIRGSKELGIASNRTGEYGKALAKVESHLQKVALSGGEKAARAQRVLNSEVALATLGMRNYTGQLKLTSGWFTRVAQGTAKSTEAQRKQAASAKTLSAEWKALKEKAYDLHRTYKQLGVSVADATRMMDRGVASGKSLSRTYKDLKVELSASNQVYKMTRREMAASEKAAHDLSRGYLTIQKYAKALSLEYNGLRVSQKALESEMMRGIKTGKSEESVYQSLRRKLRGIHYDLKRVEAGQAGLNAQMDAGSREATKMKGVLGGLGSAMKTLAYYGTSGAILYGFINGLRTGKDAVVDYSQELANLAAITGATEVEISAIDGVIRQVARTTKFSAQETAQGLVLLGQSGLTASEAMATIQSVADLAAGTLSGLVEVTDLVTTTMRAFNIQAEESSRVADVMANAVNKSKLNIDKLRTAFNYVGATAFQAGLTLEDTAQSLMVLANNGLRASSMGTGLRQVLAKLLSPSTRIREAMEANGIILDKLNPQTNDFATVLENLSGVLYNASTNSVDMSKAFELFGLRGAQAAAVLTKSFVSGEFDAIADTIFRVGTASDMAAIQAEGLGFKFKNLADVAKNVAIGMGDAGIAGALGAFIGLLQQTLIGVEAFTRSGFGDLIVKMGLASTAIWVVVVAVKALRKVMVGGAFLQVFSTQMAVASAATAGLGTSMRATTLAATALRVVTTALGGPIFWASSAIAGAVAVVWKLSNHMENLGRESAKMAVELSGAAKTLGVYAQMLGDAEEGSREYGVIIARFKKDYPELAEEVAAYAGVLDIATLSQEELTRVTREFKGEKLKDAFKKGSESLEIYKDRLDGARKAEALFGSEYKLTLHKWLGKGATAAEVTAKALEKYNTQIRAQVKLLPEMVAAGEMSREEALAQARAWADMSEVGKQAVEYLTKIFKAMDKGVKITGEAKEEVKQLTGKWASLYQELDALRRAELLSAKKSFDSQVAALKKSAKEQGVAAEELHEMVQALEKETLSKFQQKQEKKTDSLKAQLKIQKAELKTHYAEIDHLENAGDLSGKEAIHRKIEALKAYYKEASKLAADNLKKTKVIYKDDAAAQAKAAVAKAKVDSDYAADLVKLKKQLKEAAKEDRSEELTALRTKYETRLAMIEEFEARGSYSVKEANQRKFEEEELYLERRVALLETAMLEIMATEGAGSKEYMEILKKKAEAERDLAKLRKKGAKEAKKSAEESADAQKEVTQAVKESSGAISTYVSLFDKQKGTLGELTRELEKYQRLAGETKGLEVLSFMNAQYAMTVKALRGVGEEFEQVAREAGEAGLAVDLTADAFQGLTLDGFRGEIKARVESLNVFKEELASVQGSIGELSTQTKAWGGETAMAMQAAESAYAESAGSLQSALIKSKKLWMAYSSGTLADAEKIADGVIRSYQDMESSAAAYIESLKNQWGDLEEKINEVREAMRELEQETEERIRDLEKRTMNEQDRWAATLSDYNKAFNEATKLMNQGYYDEAQAMFEKAMDLAEELATEVTDESGTVLTTLSDNTTAAIDLITRASDQAKIAMENQAGDLAASQREVQAEIGRTVGEMERLQAKVKDFNQQAWEWGQKATMGGPTPMFARGGKLGGRPHSEGGTVIEAEKDEWVINRRESRKHGDAFMWALNTGLIPAEFTAAIMRGLRRFGAGGKISEVIMPSIPAPNITLPVVRPPRFETGGKVSQGRRDEMTIHFKDSAGRSASGVFSHHAGSELVSMFKDSKLNCVLSNA